jgi:hypothetical protein
MGESGTLDQASGTAILVNKRHPILHTNGHEGWRSGNGQSRPQLAISWQNPIFGYVGSSKRFRQCGLFERANNHMAVTWREAKTNKKRPGSRAGPEQTREPAIDISTIRSEI